MRFGISIPQNHGDGEFDPTSFDSFLRRAEGVGFESAWVSEQVLGTRPMLGSLETLPSVAGTPCHRRR